MLAARPDLATLFGDIGLGGVVLPLAILLLVALTFGGGGSPAPIAELIVQLATLAVLAWVALMRDSRLSILSAARRAPLLTAVGGLLLVMMLAQLVPLSPGTWQGLPGRAPLVENVSNFTDRPWLPLSIAPTLTLAAALSLIAPFAGFTLAANARTGERDWFLPLLAAFGVLTLVLELVQMSGRLYIYPSDGSSFSVGFQANRNAQGDILAILMAALATRPFTAARRASFTAVQAVIAAVLILAVILTGSRSGLAMCLALAGVVAARELWAWRHHGRRFVMTAVGAVVVLGGAGVLLATNANVARTLDRFGMDQEGRTAFIWPDAWYTAQQFLPLGSGFGSFVPAFKIFESQELLDAKFVNRAHNEFLELLIEGGWPAVALVAAGLALVLWCALRVMRAGLTPQARSRGALLLLVTLAMIAHSIVDYPIRAMSIAVLAAILLGLVVADRSDMTRGSVDEAPAKQARTKKSSVRRGSRTEQTTGQRVRMFAALGVLALVLAPLATASAFDRARRPLPANLSCLGLTPHSCGQVVSAAIAASPDTDLSAITAMMARLLPADAALQSLHGSELVLLKRPEATFFFHNSARLGWREPLGQLAAFEAAAAQGEIPRAVMHIDALLRTNPEMIENPGLIDKLVASEAIRQEWAARMKSGPSYVDALVQHIGRLAAGAPAGSDGQVDPALAATADTTWKNSIELLALARANGLTFGAETSRKAVANAFRYDRLKAADLWIALAGTGGWTQGKPAWSTTPAATNLPADAVPFVWSAAEGQEFALNVERSAANGGRLVVARGLSGSARRLAQVAVIMGQGVHELRWQTFGAEPQDLFPSISCARGGALNFQLLDPPSTDVGLAAVEVPADCGAAVITIGKGRGALKRGVAIGGIEIDRKRLLE